MKQILSLIICFFILLAFVQCAKQSSPQGGPKDEDPPVLLETEPIHQSVSTYPKELVLTFDEYIKLDNPTKNILITPRLDKTKITTTAIKNQVIITLDQDLEDSTTYVINFQNSIQDLSEGNPAENSKLVFSTGEFIDSLLFSGTINTYWPTRQYDPKNIVIGLYPASDSTDLFSDSPYYLTRADSLGSFQIENIKEGSYYAYAWLDQNNSAKAEYKTEAYDFLLDSLTISKNISGVHFNLAQADLTPFRLLRTTQSQGTYSLILNKKPVEEEILLDQIGKTVFYTYDENTLQLYPKNEIQDSLRVQFSLQDSTDQRIDTTLWVKFAPSERKFTPLQITANSGKNFTDTLKAILTFNKPIEEINLDSLYVPIDTVKKIQVTRSMFFFEDSLTRTKLHINIPFLDTLPMNQYKLIASDSTFKDIQGEYNEKGIQANYLRIKKETLADLLTGTIEDAQGPFILQLIDRKGEVYMETYQAEGNSFRLTSLEPGTYEIIVIEDKNGNKRWDPSNFFKKQHAERVFYLLNEEGAKGQVILKSGWTNEGIRIKANQKTGMNPKKPVDNPSTAGEN